MIQTSRRVDRSRPTSRINPPARHRVLFAVLPINRLPSPDAMSTGHGSLQGCSTKPVLMADIPNKMIPR